MHTGATVIETISIKTKHMKKSLSIKETQPQKGKYIKGKSIVYALAYIQGKQAKRGDRYINEQMRKWKTA